MNIYKYIFIPIITVLLFTNLLKGNNNNDLKKLNLNAGIITSKFLETKDFYVNKIDFKITFENDWFILLSLNGDTSDLAFMKPNHETQKPIFQKEFSGKGVFITIEVEDVDKVYEKVKSLGIPIEVEIRDEQWGDRHFAIVDPNGIGLDFVTNKLYN